MVREKTIFSHILGIDRPVRILQSLNVTAATVIDAAIPTRTNAHETYIFPPKNIMSGERT